MPILTRTWLALAVGAVLMAPPARGTDRDRFPLFVPRRPQTRQELDRREAVKLYAIGLIYQRDDQLLEALRSFERARALDPDAAPVHKALIPLYQALERHGDAQAACRKVLELDPNDYETWFVYARQLKTQGQLPEARAAMARGVACPDLKEHPDLRQEMYFELGGLYEAAREFAKAAKAFSEAAKILDNPEALLETGPFDPHEFEARAADLYERIGRLAVRTKKYDQAVAAFKKAQAHTKDGAGRLNYNLAEIYRAQHEYPEALESVNAYLALQPQGMEAYELKITLLRQLKRSPAEIIAELEKHARADRFNVGLRLLLARQYQAAGNVHRAERAYQELARGTPNPEVYRGLFHLYLSASEQFGIERVLRLLDATFRAARKGETNTVKADAAAQARVMLVVLKDDKELVNPLLKKACAYLQNHRALQYETCRVLAVLAGRTHQLNLAEQLYKECLRDAGPDNEAIIYGGLLRVLWEGRQYEKIVATCEKGLQETKATNHMIFHLDLALALPYVGRSDEAVKQADKAVALATDDNRLYVRLRRVSVLTLAKQYDRALAECQALLKEFTQAADVHDIRYALSNVYTAARNFPKAEAELLRLLKTNPDDATAYNDLGYIWADQGKNLKEAEEYIRKAIDLDRKQKKANHVVGTEDGKDNAAYIDSLGWALFRRGRLDEARHELEKASSLPDGDDDPVVWDHLGDVYFRLEQPARARAAWQKAVTLYKVERRRKMDQRYKEIKHKLATLKPEIQP